MRSKTLGSLLVALAVMAFSEGILGQDWFVRAGAEGGEGSRERPFADPWQALERAEAGHAIHVAEGRYVGRLGCGSWTIPFDRIQLLGGYGADFGTRDPWRHPTELRWDKGSPNWPKAGPLLTQGRDVVVDGLVIDMRDQNQYVDEAGSSLSTISDRTALVLHHPATVKNCVILNPGFAGIQCPQGSTLENNLVVNAVCWAIDIRSVAGEGAKVPAVVANNTVLFSWDPNRPGKGGYAGAAIALRGRAIVRDNILAYCDNNAVYSTVAPDTVSLTGNVFFRNRFSNLKCDRPEGPISFNDRAMDDLEELRLRACQGNVVDDPKFAMAPRWMALADVEGRSSKVESKETSEPTNPWDPPKKIDMPKGLAPALLLDEALAFMEPGIGLAAGARRRSLDTTLAKAETKAPSRTYRALPLSSWCKNPAAVEGQALEMIVARGSVANIVGLPGSYDAKTIEAVFLFDPEGQERIIGFYRKGTLIQRACTELMGSHSSGKPEALYVVRGLAHASVAIPKAAFFIESIERHAPEVSAAAAWPRGRDWFVVASARGGDGSRERPFKDPFQALEICESGDVIHVAEGEYGGRLKSGKWTIDLPHVTLCGGYDAEFRERNPWKHPTVLHCPAEFSGRREGYTLEGAHDHTGAVVDGFTFDRRLDNTYTTPVLLDPKRANSKEHIWFSMPGCVIRNCTFMNGAFGALRMSNGQTVENCIFANHVTQVIRVERGHTSEPLLFRRNTLAFVWDEKPGIGRGRTGSLIDLTGGSQAVIRDNVFEFADNDALRLSTDMKGLVLEGNRFAHNLWSHVQHMPTYSTIDDTNWASLLDLGLRGSHGNTRGSTSLTLPPEWLALYLHARGGSGKLSKEQAEALLAQVGPPTSVIAQNTEVFAPPMARTDALALSSKDSTCLAGARACELSSTFDGVARTDPSPTSYSDVAWPNIVSADGWDRLDGQSIVIRVAMAGVVHRFDLAGHTATNSVAFEARGPLVDSGGLPIRAYVVRGTRLERTVRNADVPRGRPEETFVLRGVAFKGRQMRVDAIERDN